MGNKAVGKKFKRQTSLEKLQTTDFTKFPKYSDGPKDFFETRIEFREALEEWGYFWSNKLVEDAFVRPNFDLSLLKKISNMRDEEEVFPIDQSMFSEEPHHEDAKDILTDKVNMLNQQLDKK